MTQIIMTNGELIAAVEKFDGMAISGQTDLLLVTLDEQQATAELADEKPIFSDALLIPNTTGVHARPAAVLAGLAKKDPKGFGFIAIEKNEPYFSSSVVLTAADVSLAEAETERLLDVYTNCVRTDYWYGYNGFDSHSGIEPLYRVKALPEWHRYKREQSTGFRGA